MENNNERRKAHIHYLGTSIPVRVVHEDTYEYLLKLDWTKLVYTIEDTTEVWRIRKLYIDAMFGYTGAHDKYGTLVTTRHVLYLHKGNPDVTLTFEGPEQENEEMEDPDNVVPLPIVPPLTGLDKQLKLMADLGYKIKSFDVDFREDGEAHLRATLANEVGK